MKTIATFFLFIFSYSNIFAGGILKSGNQIIVTSMTDINSEINTQPNFIIASDIKDPNGNILIAQGTEVITETTLIKRKGVGKPGEIQIKFISTKSVDGQTILLNGTKNEIGVSNKGKALGVGLGVGLGTFLLPMLAFIAKKGEPAILKSGTIFSNITTIGEYQIK